MPRESAARLRNYLANALTLVVTVALCLLALEAYVRLVEDDGMQYDLEMWKYAKAVKIVSSDPRIGHEHRPYADGVFMGARITTDSAGFRNGEVAIEKPAGSKRVMMLGDSVLLGWGVKQDQTISARLQNAWRAAGHDVEVINTGIGNYNTTMEVEFFLRRAAQYQPDIVVLNYFINDPEPIPSHDTTWLERNSEAAVFFGTRFSLLRRELALQPDWRSYYSGLYDDSRNPGGWKAVVDAVEALAAYCKSKGIELLIVNYPELHVLKPYPFPEVGLRLAALADRLGVPHLDLLGSVEDQNPADLWVTRADPHPNARADALFAQAIEQWFDRNKFLPPETQQ